MKDWTGNSKTTFTTIGASNHVEEERQSNDFYATHPKAITLLLQLEQFDGNIWECACGMGHLSKPLIDAEYKVKSTDLIDRGYGEGGINFLSYDNNHWNGDIITNPPYKYASEFILKSLKIIPLGNKVAMFLKTTFMESEGRKDLFTKNPPKTIWVSCNRIPCAKNGDFEALKKSGGSAVSYCWYIWEKGFTGTTSLKWFN